MNPAPPSNLTTGAPLLRKRRTVQIKYILLFFFLGTLFSDDDEQIIKNIATVSGYSYMKELSLMAIPKCAPQKK